MQRDELAAERTRELSYRPRLRQAAGRLLPALIHPVGELVELEIGPRERAHEGEQIRAVAGGLAARERCQQDLVAAAVAERRIGARAVVLQLHLSTVPEVAGHQHRDTMLPRALADLDLDRD